MSGGVLRIPTGKVHVSNDQSRELTISIESDRGVATVEEARAWTRARNVSEVECIVPDQSGVARGKLMPVAKFFSSNGMNMPQSIFYQTISGDYPELGEISTIDPADGDYVFKPDYSTLTMVPWESDPTAQVMHDAFHRDGRPVDIASTCTWQARSR